MAEATANIGGFFFVLIFPLIPSFFPSPPNPEAFRYATKGFSLWQITTAEGGREKRTEKKKRKKQRKRQQRYGIRNYERGENGKRRMRVGGGRDKAKDPYGVASILKPQIPGNDLRKDRSLVLFLSFLQLTRN